jgi:Zn-dependent protease with chaperone function
MRMRRLAWTFVLLLLIPAHFQTSAQEANRPSPQISAQTSSSAQSRPAASYSLSPDRRAMAIAYSHLRYTLYFVGNFLSLMILFLLWRSGLTLAFRQWSQRVSQKLIVQCLIFVPLFVAAYALLNLPFDCYSGFVLPHRFGLSTQALAAWLGDWGKSLVIAAILGSVVAWVFYRVVRASPRRWWFFFWMASIPLVLGFILIEPEVIEPVFDRFTPLERTEPELTRRIEAMLGRAGLSIPESRIFEMDASARTKELNAYVSGIGASKRVVIWDTTLKKMSSDEILLVLGHESGHYVLDHIPKEFALDEGVALVLFLIGFFAVDGIVRRFGTRQGVPDAGDLAALPLVLIVFTILSLLADPIVNGISRHYEHQADQFGLEAAYGTVADPNAAEVNALQILGAEDLSDPAPSPFIKFWLYSHPPLDERIRFAASYHPWSEGKPMELLPATK